MLTLSGSPFARVGPAQRNSAGKSRRALPAHRPSRKSALPRLRLGPQTLSRECYPIALFTSGAQYAFVAEIGTQP